MRHFTFALTSLFLTAGLGACGGDEPIEQSFTKALNAYHAQNPQCVVAAAKIDKAGKSGPYKPARAGRPSSLDRLSEAGLMVRTEKVTGQKTEVFYQATSLGLKQLEPSSFGGDVMKACFGTRHVTEIIGHTELIETDGVTATEVTYKFTMENTPKWAHHQGMQDKFRQLEFDMKSGGNERSEGLVKTASGWMHPDLTK